jgi:hypothetical protein
VKRLSFDIGAVAPFVVDVPDEDTARVIEAEMDPYKPVTLAREPAVVLTPGDSDPAGFCDIQNPARDELTTASDGASLYLARGGSWLQLPDPDARPLTFAYGPGFPMWDALSTAVRPALQLSLPDRNAVAVHSAAVDLEGAGIVIAGWSESGKTETALAFMESGARLISDKWTVLRSDGELATFPMTVGIRRWVLEHLPKLKAALPTRARRQFQVAAAAAFASRPIRKRKAKGRVTSMAVSSIDRALRLGDRAALGISDLNACYGHPTRTQSSTPIRAFVILTTIPGNAIEVSEGDPRRAARRMARSALVERGDYYRLFERGRWAFPSRNGNSMDETAGREEENLTKWLDDVHVLEVRAPFPTDPRLVADAILDRL